MAQQYCSFGLPADAALLARHTGTITEGFHLHTAVDLDWATASVETMPADRDAWDIVGGAVGVDVLHYTWLLVAFVGCAGAAHPLLLVKEQAVSGIAGVLSGAGISADFAVWGRVVGGRIELFTQ